MQIRCEQKWHLYRKNMLLRARVVPSAQAYWRARFGEEFESTTQRLLTQNLKKFGIASGHMANINNLTYARFMPSDNHQRTPAWWLQCCVDASILVAPQRWSGKRGQQHIPVEIKTRVEPHHSVAACDVIQVTCQQLATDAPYSYLLEATCLAPDDQENEFHPNSAAVRTTLHTVQFDYELCNDFMVPRLNNVAYLAKSLLESEEYADAYRALDTSARRSCIVATMLDGLNTGLDVGTAELIPVGHHQLHRITDALVDVSRVSQRLT
jgi:hypothetical protein